MVTQFVPQLPGLLYGLGLVAASNVGVVCWHALWRASGLAKPVNRRKYGDTAPDFEWAKSLKKHLSSWEGYFLLVTYLSSVWYGNLLPNSYYDFDSPLVITDVLWQLVFVDFFGFVVHLIEHAILGLYVRSHKPHHQYINPKLLE